MQPFEVIEVQSLEVMCDGSGQGTSKALGHPRVFLHIDQDKGEITCPYCSRTYVLALLANKSNH
jgi:uncharacterized Zn-finger protein